MTLPPWLQAWLSLPRKALIPGPFARRFLKRPANLLVIVEGPHDIEFLKRISAILSAADPTLPDLAAMERRGEVVFVPAGGGDLWLWADRFAPLELAEFHLYDREERPESGRRQRIAEAVNRRPWCRAAVTAKRSLENYLHPAAIQEVCGIKLDFTDDDPVADRLAEQLYRTEGELPWSELPRRVLTRRRNRVKRWLHTKAAERMTSARLAETDPKGEVRFWLASIAYLAARSVGLNHV
jgi:hypothetical protein